MSSYNVYNTALFQHHNEHERWPALFEIQNELPTGEFWMLFRDLIEASHILFPHQEIMRRMMTAERLNHIERLFAWTARDKDWWKRMLRRGNPVKVYRGGATPNYTGFAWTTNRARAEQYAINSGAKKPTITVGYLKPSDIVLAMYDPSSEIIAFPEQVDIRHMEEVPNHSSQEFRTGQTLRVAVAWKGANAPMECTPVEYFQMAIERGATTKEDIVTQLESSLKFLSNLGFTARIERIKEVLEGL